MLKELKEQGLDHKIIALSFDTTTTNTGMIRGACIRIEKDLGRDLLWLVCEVILKSAFNACYGKSSGPAVEIFDRFRKKWPRIIQKEAVAIYEIAEHSDDNHEATYFREVLQTSQDPREDYEELIRLTYFFLTGDMGDWKEGCPEVPSTWSSASGEGDAESYLLYEDGYLSSPTARLELHPLR